VIYCVKSINSTGCSTFKVLTVDHAVTWRDVPSANDQNTSTVRLRKLDLKTATRRQEYSPFISWWPQACARDEGRQSKSFNWKCRKRKGGWWQHNYSSGAQQWSSIAYRSLLSHRIVIVTPCHFWVTAARYKNFYCNLLSAYDMLNRHSYAC
jgi:hypothetical protein